MHTPISIIKSFLQAPAFHLTTFVLVLEIQIIYSLYLCNCQRAAGEDPQRRDVCWSERMTSKSTLGKLMKFLLKNSNIETKSKSWQGSLGRQWATSSSPVPANQSLPVWEQRVRLDHSFTVMGSVAWKLSHNPHLASSLWHYISVWYQCNVLAEDVHSRFLCRNSLHNSCALVVLPCPGWRRLQGGSGSANVKRNYRNYIFSPLKWLAARLVPPRLNLC